MGVRTPYASGEKETKRKMSGKRCQEVVKLLRSPVQTVVRGNSYVLLPVMRACFFNNYFS